MASRVRKKEKKRGYEKTDLPWLFYLFFGAFILILPVFILPQAMDQTLIPRMLFTAIVLLLCAPMLFSKKRLVSWEYPSFHNPLFLVVAGYLAITVISALFALNSGEIFFDIVRNLLFFIGLIFSTTILKNTRSWSERLSVLFLIAAAIAIVIGLAQYYNRVLLSPSPLLPDGRALVYAVTGLFSHKNFLSSALFLMLPFVAYGVYKFRGKQRLLSLLVAVATLLLILILGTRSVWLGLFVGGSLAAAILMFWPGNFELPARFRKWFLIGTAAAFALFLALYVTSDPADDFSFSGRVRSIVDLESQHNIHRINIWSGTSDIIKANPFLGVGPGNWMIHVPAHFDHNFDELRALGWSQPHNDFLWVAAEKGIPGLLLFLAIYLIPFGMLLRVIFSARNRVGQENKVLALLLLSGLAGYLTDSFFSFPYERTDAMVLHMILIASAFVIYSNAYKMPVSRPRRIASLVLLTPLLGFSILFSVHSIRLEKHFGMALTALRAGNYHSMIHHVEHAKTPFRSMGPHLYPPEFLEGVAHQRLNNPRRAVDAFEKARRQAPYDIRILHLLAKNHIDVNNPDKAFPLFVEIAAIFPPSPEIVADMKRLSIAYYELGNLQKTRETLLLIPNWEDDPEVSRNMQIIEEMIESEAG